MNAITTVTATVPSTLAASLAPIAPMDTAQLVSTESTSTIGTSGEEAEKLVKSMEEMHIHTTEINKLKEKVTILETDYKLIKNMHKEEVQKVANMSKRLKAMEKDLTLKEPLGKC